MSTIQLLFGLYFAFICAYLSAVLARVLRQNERLLDKMDKGFRKMGEGFKLIAKLIVEENDRTRKEIMQALRS